jgi:hypothetical protein
MDRPKRRFVPLPAESQEFLEDRLCMSTSQLSSGLPGMGQQAYPQSAQTGTVAGFGSTSNQYSIRRETRIQRVPASFYEIDPTQRIPRETTAAIQEDLTAMLNTLDGRTQPNQRAAMNQLFRGMISSSSVSSESLAGLNKVFGEMLISAGGDPNTVASLQSNMLKVSQAAIQSSTLPSFAISNNYVFMYYAATTVGYAIPTPPAPTLVPRMNQNPSGDPVTTSRRPQFTGRYPQGMMVEILNVADGSVIARGASQSNGRFTLTANAVMNPGEYVLTSRGTTPAGETSEFSPNTNLTITASPSTSRSLA